MKTVSIIGLLLIITSVTFSQSEADLAKATQNPLATMYSLAFQNNTTYGVGSSFVALTMLDKCVMGIDTNNVLTFGDREENKFAFQYFINYNLPKVWYIVSAQILTANWNAPGDSRWIIPFGCGAGKVYKIGKLPINRNAQVYYNTKNRMELVISNRGYNYSFYYLKDNNDIT